MSELDAAWHAHHAIIKGFLRRRLADVADADDLLQETFLRLLRSRTTLPDADAARAWLLRTARNLVADHYRAASRSLPLDEELPATESALPTPLQTLDACVGPLAEKLPEKYRHALALELEGVPQQEIANRHGIGLSGAKSRVQRARQLLRREFERCCHFRHDADGTLLDYLERPGEQSCI